MQRAVADFLDAAGLSDDPDTLRTPERVAKMWSEQLIDGYDKKPDEIVTRLSVTRSQDIVIVRDLEVNSVCPHHLLPYPILAQVAFLPNGKTTGFSRVAALVELYAHRLALLEDLAGDIAQGVMDALQADGAACYLHSAQSCMHFQGVKRQRSRVDAFAVRGAFKKPALRREVRSLFLTEPKSVIKR